MGIVKGEPLGKAGIVRIRDGSYATSSVDAEVLGLALDKGLLRPFAHYLISEGD
jgi:hypothetical protein